MKYTDPSGHYVESAIDIAFLAMDLNDIRTGNADKWTYAGLGVDLVCAALPVATGGRLAVTAVEETVTHADNVGDLFKLLDKTTEVATTGNKVDNVIDAGQAVNHADDAFNSLDWDSVVSKTGETRREHIMLHADVVNGKAIHGIFNGDPIEMTNKAWANRGSIKPIRESTADIYYIPYENAGTELGDMGSKETLNYVKIVVQQDTNKLISSYPSKLPE